MPGFSIRYETDYQRLLKDYLAVLHPLPNADRVSIYEAVKNGFIEPVLLGNTVLFGVKSCEGFMALFNDNVPLTSFLDPTKVYTNEELADFVNRLFLLYVAYNTLGQDELSFYVNQAGNSVITLYFQRVKEAVKSALSGNVQCKAMAKEYTVFLNRAIPKVG